MAVEGDSAPRHGVEGTALPLALLEVNRLRSCTTLAERDGFVSAGGCAVGGAQVTVKLAEESARPGVSVAKAMGAIGPLPSLSKETSPVALL